MLDVRISELKKELIAHATLVEHMINKSVRGLLMREREHLLRR